MQINKLTEEQKDRIEELVTYRFNHRISTRNIYDWLQNFKEAEVDDALTILSHVDYYTEEDIINTLRCCIEPYIKKNLHFVPIGTAGKSGQSMVYVIQGIMKSYRPKQFHYYTSVDELKGTTLTNKDVVFLVDDVIGSGKTFCDFVKAHHIVGSLLSVGAKAEVILLAVVISQKGKERLAMKFPRLGMLGEEKPMAFSHYRSCFGSHYKMKPYREMAFKYGKRLTGKKTNALGYDNSQQLIVFSHSIPNNSLPIFWSTAKGWIPLVPRFALDRGQRALNDRNECNRWLVFFRDFFHVRREDIRDLFQDPSKYRAILVLRLKMKNMAEANIANRLGLHFAEMETVWAEGEKAELWDKNHTVTEKCLKRYKELLKKAEFLNTAERHRMSLQTDEEKYMYVPETFRSLK